MVKSGAKTGPKKIANPLNNHFTGVGLDSVEKMLINPRVAHLENNNIFL